MNELSPKAQEFLTAVRQALSLQITIKKTGKAAEPYRTAVNELVSGGHLRIVNETETDTTLSLV